jgi:hypothetical protein
VIVGQCAHVAGCRRRGNLSRSARNAQRPRRVIWPDRGGHLTQAKDGSGTFRPAAQAAARVLNASTRSRRPLRPLCVTTPTLSDSLQGAVHMQITTIGLDIAKNVFQVPRH